MNERILTFELAGDNELEIHVDAKGLEDLIGYLTRLKAGEHDHLMTPSWGGHELGEQLQRPGARLVNKVTIRRW